VASSLWTDVEALQRLARSQRAALRGAGGTAMPESVPQGPFPPVPERPELEIQARDLTARLATGDYCDFFFVSGTELALVMADVSGKGVPAAVLRGVTRSVLRNLACPDIPPGRTLSRLNRILSAADLGAMFVTLFFGQYRTDTGLLRYANAGHPVPYRIGRGGEVTTLGEVTGPILGVLESQEYADKQEWLEMGETLVLYTDGVTEAANPAGEFFGPGRLFRLLAEHALEPPRRLGDLVGESIRSFQVGRPQDDATILVLRRNS